MDISIRKPLGYSRIGCKEQQEDAVWPSFSEVNVDSSCIVLCDGVGGSAHGEIASQTASKVIGEYLTGVYKEKNTVEEDDVQKAVNLAYDELEKIDNEPSEEGTVSMATTLTCVCIHHDGILVAHMGDSRIYHVRPEHGLLYQSADHSLVNALLQAGELTIEEAKSFSRKNVITKAIQPHSEKRFKAEVHQLTDIKAGDYLFLCCDGVLEQLTNERLVEILSEPCSDTEKIKLLEDESTNRTKDNYTAYLIPINNVEGSSSLSNEDEISVDIVEDEIVNKEIYKTEQPSQQALRQEAPQQATISKRIFPYISFLVCALVVIALTILIAKKYTPDANKDEPNEIIDTIHHKSIDQIIKH